MMRDSCEKIWQLYESRKLKKFEPNWIHYAYELVKKYLDGKNLSNKELDLVTQIIQSHSLPDGYAVPALPSKPNGDTRIIHDGWKAGSTTWIFMGRTENNVVPLSNGWIAVKRTLPQHLYSLLKQDLAPDTLWCAYHLDKQMGIDSDENCVGPAIYFDQLRQELINLGFTN